MKKIISIALLALVLTVGAFSSAAQAGTSPLTGWAWSSNIGWISFNSANTGAGSGATYSVKISTTTPTAGSFNGYAWSPNIGWISFNSSDLTGCTGAVGTQADLSTGSVSGWIRALAGVGQTNGWDGCIELSGTNHETVTGLSGTAVSSQGVSFNPTSKVFSGYAWGSDVIGWMSFNALTGTGVTICPGGNCPPTSNLPTATISALPTAVISGSAPSISWSSTNATACTGTNFSTGNAVSGNAPGQAQTTSVTYTVICTGAGGTSAPASVTVGITTVSGGSCSMPAKSQTCPGVIYASSDETPIPPGTASTLTGTCPTTGTNFCVYTCVAGYQIKGNRCSNSDVVPI